MGYNGDEEEWWNRFYGPGGPMENFPRPHYVPSGDSDKIPHMEKAALMIEQLYGFGDFAPDKFVNPVTPALVGNAMRPQEPMAKDTWNDGGMRPIFDSEGGSCRLYLLQSTI